MDQKAVTSDRAGRARVARPRGRTRLLWRRVRQPLVESEAFKQTLASVLAGFLRFVKRTNRLVEGSCEIDDAIARHTPAVIALWHGQHLLAPAFNPRSNPLTALFSRSADAELNALVAGKLGFGIVRGSGGREGERKARKGGAQALIALKRVLDKGGSVAMIADIAHGAPRQAGAGVVTLARITGRPVVPLAVATSRRKVLERTWDKTTINLPFGRASLVVGEPVHVPADADEATIEAKRREVTDSLNRATAEAYRLVDGRR
jgi:lysophospholipid acyltransferase (LPLAT)-like uncharacterized protein